MMKLRRRYRHFIRGRRINCDTEATGLNPWKGDRPYAFSFCNEDFETVYFEFPVDPKTRRVRYEAKPKTFAALKKFFADSEITTVWHNAKFDRRHCELAGLPIAGRVEDTEYKLRLCNSTLFSYELKPVAKELFDIGDEDEKELQKATSTLRTKARPLGFAVLPAGESAAPDYWLVQYAEEILVQGLKVLKTYRNGTPNARRKMEEQARDRGRAMRKLCREYAVKDVIRGNTLDTFLEPLLDEYEIRHIFNEEMFELFPVTYAMEGRGVYLERAEVEAGLKRANEEAAAARQEIQEICADAEGDYTEKFAGSAPQKIKYFIGELGLEPFAYGKKTKSGDRNPKIDHTFLEHYEEQVPMAGAIMREGKATKAASTYLANYLQLMDEDCIIHANAQQCGAKTGRFSIRGPSLQNVPKRWKCPRCREDFKPTAFDGPRAKCAKCRRWVLLDMMLEVRRPFRPRPGFVWYCFDFKQIEARLFADYAEEERMLEAFQRNEDPYQMFADVINDAANLGITRQPTKSIFLGKLYGLGRRKLIRSIQNTSKTAIDEDTAAGIIETFDESFPGVEDFMNAVMDEAKTNRYIVNRYGQRIDIKEPFFDPESGKMFDECYRGVNYIIQSSAARLMKRAMIRAYDYLQRLGYGWLVLTIHDELIFEFPLDRRPRRVIQDLADLMADNLGMFPRVKTPVDASKCVGTWLMPSEITWITSP